MSVVNFSHLERMTDDTGLLEHAFGCIPRRGEGYTTDDNVRALWASTEWIRFLLAEGDDYSLQQAKQLSRLTDIYLAFTNWALQEDGTLHNNYAYDRQLETETPSDDCLGRTLWGCAAACDSLVDADRKFVAAALFAEAFQKVDTLKHLRGIASALAASCRMATSPAKDLIAPLSGKLSDVIRRFEQKLILAYKQNATPNWHWFQPQMSYSNGLLPWALLQSYQITGHAEALQIGQEALDFLIGKMTAPAGNLRPIGNESWCDPQQQSQWDQQPVEILALAMAAESAASIDRRYAAVIGKCRDWFSGDNDLHVPVADPEDGSCCDGLRESGVNRNQGAESTLSYLLTELIAERAVRKDKEKVRVGG